MENNKSLIFMIVAILFCDAAAYTPARANTVTDDYDTTNCLILEEITSFFVYVSNKCKHSIEMTYCVQDPNKSEGCGTNIFYTDTINSDSKSTQLRFVFVGPDSKVFFLGCKNPWSAENVRMENGDIVADKCSW